MMLFTCNIRIIKKFSNLNSILIVNLLFLTAVLVQFNGILFIESKCVMRGPCSTNNVLEINDDPLGGSLKWYNCLYENEPLPLENEQGVADFKRLCAPMYKDDKQPLCCNSEQLTILKKSLLSAEAVIGSCASCYLNFRMLWCQMTCSPNQSDFVFAKKIEEKIHINFTDAYNAHVKHQIEKRLKEREQNKCAKDNVVDDEEEHVDEQKEELPQHETEEHNNNHEQTVTNESNHDVVKRNVENKKMAVIDIEYHISNEFLENLVDSCRDIKLYGEDAIMSICGVKAIYCTPSKMMEYLGLVVPEKPFDIYAIITNLTEYNIDLEFELNGSIRNKNYLIKPAKPKHHRCNETYQYGDLDYGAKCGCKACHDSCQLYDEFKVAKRQQHFKIGPLDGPAFIMALIFGLFVLIFLKIVTFFRKKHRKSKEMDPFYTKKRNSLTSGRNFFRKFFSFSNRAKTEVINQDLRTNIAMEQIDPMDAYGMNPLSMDDINYEEKNVIFPKSISRLNILDKMKYFGEKLESFIEDKFTRLGKFCASYPSLVLTIGLTYCALMCMGYFNFKVEKDPVKLWSADSSIARQNKKYFDDNFNPFYRITQLIIEPKSHIYPYIQEINGKNKTIHVFQNKVLNEAFELYTKINAITAVCENCEEKETIRLEDICYQPLWPENKNCATQAIFQYWQNKIELVDESLKDNNAQNHLLGCMNNPYTSNCLSAFGGPIHPYMVAGSYSGEEYLEAKAIVITYVIKNYKKNSIEPIKKAMAWESEVLLLLKNYNSSLIDIAYTTERSIEDELERESKADIKIIAISYLMMFAYLTATLGKYSSLNLRVILLEMKIFLALAGVTLVLLSVFSSGGFFTYLGVPATLITLEVIPFLLLAVGVDNIYVMVQTYQNDERLEFESVEDQIARIVGKVGPSMLLTGTTQSAAFLISAMTPMPGVRAFSLYASLAIILNFFMQITCFVVLLTLDAKREKAKRVDMLCCLKLNLSESQINNGQKSFLHKCFRDVYTPFLFNDYVRASVIVIFVGFFFSCISMCDKIKIGLDQKLAMPSDSYQIKYFEALQKHLKVGPPVYFVLKDGYNYSDTNLLRLLCGASNCDSNSLQSIISAASVFPNETYIAQSTVNWMDDYMEWLSADPDGSTSSTCCHIHTKTNKFCDLREYNKDPIKSESIDDCVPCPVERTAYGFPTNESLYTYLDIFLNQNPSETCVKAGHAMYGTAVNTKLDESHSKVKEIRASHFMAYHTVLSTSDDFINAMISANQISDLINKILNNHSITNNITDGPKYEVIPYSIFYVFYEQYVKIWQDATAQLLLTLIAIFICTFILLSFDLFTSLIVTGVIAIIIIDMVGIMYLWNIELNAISLVNLVIAIGISVEFSSHIARAFATSDAKNKKQRASEALYTMGPPVFSGVLQSIVGISVLAFAHSQLFQVFYFRMYFSILVLGLTHGLIFLPVLLSYIGSNLKTTSNIGRSSNKLQYLKVNQKNDSPIGLQKISTNGQENQQISDSDQQSNPIEEFKETSLKNITNEIELTSWYDQNRKTSSSPNKTPAVKASKKNRKHFNKKSLIENECSANDRDSPTSKKSVDLLINNDHNSLENNFSSNSSHGTSSLNENQSIDITVPEMNKSESIENKNGLKTKLNTIFKKNREKTDGKFHKITSNGDNNDDDDDDHHHHHLNDQDQNPYKNLTISNSKSEIDYLKRASLNFDKTPSLSIHSAKIGVHNNAQNGSFKNNEKLLSQSFNVNHNKNHLLNSNNSITGLIDKMNEKMPNYVSLTKLNGNHVDINNSLPEKTLNESNLSMSDQSSLSIRNFN